MLTIRSEQMRALQRARLRRFERHALAHVERALPQLMSAMIPTADHVRAGVARGVRYFASEEDVARYVEIVLRHLGGFTDDDHPLAALEMIQSASIPAARRLDNFERWASMRGSQHAQ